MEYEIRYEDGIFFVRLSGPVELDVVRRYFKDLFSHPQWKPGALLLADHRGLKRNWSDRAMYPAAEAAASGLAKYRDKLVNARFAAVYPADSEVSVVFGLFELLLRYLKLPLERRVFDDMNEALAWLKGSEQRQSSSRPVRV